MAKSRYRYPFVRTRNCIFSTISSISASGLEAQKICTSSCSLSYVCRPNRNKCCSRNSRAGAWEKRLLDPDEIHMGSSISTRSSPASLVSWSIISPLIWNRFWRLFSQAPPVIFLSSVTVTHTLSERLRIFLITLFCIGVNPVNPSRITWQFFISRDSPILSHSTSSTSSPVIYRSLR